MDNFAVPGSNGDDENLFDFEAVSSTGPWAGTHNDDAPSTAADYRSHPRRASFKCSASPSNYGLVPPEVPQINYHVSKNFDAFSPSPYYNAPGLLLPPNFDPFDDFDTLRNENTQLHEMGGLRSLAQIQSEEAAGKIGTFPQSVPEGLSATGKSGYVFFLYYVNWAICVQYDFHIW
ncbi:hypothetical protein MMC34_006991 [Xylographa carneopallida]|nr:hypothetical protein [Xylographa carneopallida]